MSKANKIKLTIIAFGVYFLTGVTCFVVGVCLPELSAFYGREIDSVVLLVSSLAVGRVLTAYFTGKAVDKYGPLKVLFVACIFANAYIGLITLIDSFYVGLALAFFAGVGLGVQDSACPLILSEVYKDNYASALSAGQGLFCMGSFLLSFLVGLTKSFNVSYTYAFIIIAIIGLVITAIIPFAKLNITKTNNEETIKPLYTNRKWLAIIAAYACIFLYCALTNNEGTYISSYIDYLGNNFGSYVLTVYNAGCLIGAFAFAAILRKVSEKLVVFINCLCAFIAMFLAEIIRSNITWFVCYFVVGFFIGVLFSLIVSIITRIGYKHISLFGSLVGVIGGAGDIVTPIITGALIKQYTLSFSPKIGMIILILLCISSLIILLVTKEEENTNGYSK